jgi:hypothetical protein
MRVYVIMAGCDYEGSDLLGVFSSRRLAEEKIMSGSVASSGSFWHGKLIGRYYDWIGIAAVEVDADLMVQ